MFQKSFLVANSSSRTLTLNFYQFIPSTNVNSSIVFGSIDPNQTVLIEFKNGLFYSNQQPMSIEVFQETKNEYYGNLVLCATDSQYLYYTGDIRWFNVSRVEATDVSTFITASPTMQNFNWKVFGYAIAGVAVAVGSIGIAGLIIRSRGNKAQIISKSDLKDRVFIYSESSVQDYLDYLENGGTYAHFIQRDELEGKIKTALINGYKLKKANPNANIKDFFKNTKIIDIEPDEQLIKEFDQIFAEFQTKNKQKIKISPEKIDHIKSLDLDLESFFQIFANTIEDAQFSLSLNEIIGKFFSIIENTIEALA
jgi:hypothetical protein